jgi:hypothetical protein
VVKSLFACGLGLLCWLFAVALWSVRSVFVCGLLWRWLWLLWTLADKSYRPVQRTSGVRMVCPHAVCLSRTSTRALITSASLFVSSGDFAATLRESLRRSYDIVLPADTALVPTKQNIQYVKNNIIMLTYMPIYVRFVIVMLRKTQLTSWNQGLKPQSENPDSS